MRALIVEDNPYFSDYLKNVLVHHYGSTVEIIVCETLACALDQTSEGHYDIILLDLRLPDANDLQGLSKLIDNRVTTPIIVLTGAYDYSEDQAVAMGAKAFIVKTNAHPAVLISAIDRLISNPCLPCYV